MPENDLEELDLRTLLEGVPISPVLLFLFIAPLSLSATFVFLKDFAETLDCFESGVFEDLTEAGVCPLTVSSETTALPAREEWFALPLPLLVLDSCPFCGLRCPVSFLKPARRSYFEKVSPLRSHAFRAEVGWPEVL